MAIFVKNEEDSRNTDIVYLKSIENDFKAPGWTNIAGSTNSGLGSGISQMRTTYITGDYYSINDGWVHTFDSNHHWAYNVPNNQWEFMDYGQHNLFSDDTLVTSIDEDIYLYRNFDDSSTRGIYKWNKGSGYYDMVSSIPGNEYTKHVEFIFSLGGYLHVVVHESWKHYKISKQDLDDSSISINNKNWIELSNPWSIFDPGTSYAFWTMREKCVIPFELEGLVYIIKKKNCYKWIEQTDELITIPDSEFSLTGMGFYNSAAVTTPGLNSSHLLHIIGGYRGTVTTQNPGAGTALFSTTYTDDEKYHLYDKLSLSLVDSNLNASFRGSSEYGYGCAAFIYNDGLYIINSYDKSVYKFLHGVTESISIYGPTSWTEVGNLPEDFGNSGVSVVYNNELHILGLNNGTGHYKLTSNGWVSVSTLPMSIGAYEYIPPEWEEGSGYYVYTSGFAVVLNNKIHLVYHHKHYTWDPSNGWVLLHSNADVPFYSNGCVIVFNNEIHILGYWYDTGSMLGPDPEGEHYVYSNGQWSNINPGNYQDDEYRLNDLYLIRGGIKANAFVYNNELYLLSNENGSWDPVAGKAYKNLFKWNGNSSNSIWTEVTTARNVIPFIRDNNAKQRKSSIVFANESGIDYLYENYQYRFQGTTWELVDDDNPFSIKYGGSANFLNNLGYAMSGSKYYTSGRVLDPLYSHIFNKIKGIWTKVKVPTYDEYGNCTMIEQAKRVKAVWVGGPDNKAKRVY